jgi:hypothetical protein
MVGKTSLGVLLAKSMVRLHQTRTNLARLLLENCSHARSNMYFIESINKRNITARLARMNEQEEFVFSSKTDEVIFGDAVPTTAKGMYYLKTNSSSPYLIPRKTNKKT